MKKWKPDWFYIGTIAVFVSAAWNIGVVVGRDEGRKQSYEAGNYECVMAPKERK